jgi:tellurite resistance-related uncharacterized protein
MKCLPDNVTAYKKTPEFDETSVPKGLLKSHQTKDGVWGKIVVLEGQLKYMIAEPEEEVIIFSSTISGVVEPTIFHEVELVGEVRFYVEFYRDEIGL